jgi:hypothetical protein
VFVPAADTKSSRPQQTLHHDSHDYQPHPTPPRHQTLASKPRTVHFSSPTHECGQRGTPQLIRIGIGTGEELITVSPSSSSRASRMHEQRINWRQSPKSPPQPPRTPIVLKACPKQTTNSSGWTGLEKPSIISGESLASSRIGPLKLSTISSTASTQASPHVESGSQGGKPCTPERLHQLAYRAAHCGVHLLDLPASSSAHENETALLASKCHLESCDNSDNSNNTPIRVIALSSPFSIPSFDFSNPSETNLRYQTTSANTIPAAYRTLSFDATFPAIPRFHKSLEIHIS